MGCLEKQSYELFSVSAEINRIEVEKLGSKKGILFGRSIPLKANTIAFVSEKHGMQVWYEHEGECGSCERYDVELLLDFAEEMKLRFHSIEDPTKIADKLLQN